MTDFKILEDVKLLASGLKFPEGPIAMADGSVILVEIQGKTLTRVTAEGEVNVIADCGGGPNGAAIGPDGRVYICNDGGFRWLEPMPGLTFPGDPSQPDDYIGGSIQAVDLKTGAIENLYTECNGHPLKGPNDIVFDEFGNFWFTDYGKTREREEDRGFIYYASTDGKMICEMIGTHCPPNGIGLSPDGKKLYYAETISARVFLRTVTGPGELEPAGMLSPNEMLMASQNYQFFDSLAVDGAGNVCVATIGLNNGITVISPDGKSIELHQLPPEFQDLLTTNICFGGADFRTAYITCSSTGRLVSCKWPYPGLRLHYN
jgi:gluconolactonase